MRKDRILEKVKKDTIELIRNNDLINNGINAIDIADELNLDRANVSRELNKMWKRGELIKVQGRPILFLDYQTIKSEYPNSYVPSTIARESNIFNYISKQTTKQKPIVKKTSSPLDNILGYNGSLKNKVSNAIAAISYPPQGLPILICGNTGIGKREFAENLFYYAIEQKIKDDNAQFVVINCHDYTSDEDFRKKLFGYTKLDKNVKGIIEQANNGVVYLENIQYLSTSSLSLLSETVNNAGYSRASNNRKNRNINFSLIASTDINNKDQVAEKATGLFPVVIDIPDFDHRPPFEKIEAILSYFANETIKISRSIRMNKSIIFALANDSYKDNEQQLKNEIQLTCSKAYLSSKDKTDAVTIDYFDLPEKISAVKLNNDLNSQYLQSTLNLYNKDYISIDENGNCDALNFYKNIVARSSYNNLKQFIDSFDLDLAKIDSTNDFIINMIHVLRTCDDDYLNGIKSNTDLEIVNIFINALSSDEYYQTIIDNKYIIYGISLVTCNFLKNAYVGKDSYKTSLYSVESNEYNIVEKINKDFINKNIGRLSINEKDFIINYLQTSRAILLDSKASVLVICHGNSIARELCEQLQDIAKDQGVILSHLDIMYDLQLNDILVLAKNEVNKINTGAGVVVLVDKYPLDGIEEYLKNECSKKVKVFSSVSYNRINKIINECGKYSDINSIAFNDEIKIKEDENKDLIDMLIENVISKTTLYINPKRASNVLMHSLKSILDSIGRQYSTDIAVKFITHGVHMIERVIIGNPLPYYHLKLFINENYQLMDIISKALEPVENTFDKHIPETEIAYIAEIFLES